MKKHVDRRYGYCPHPHEMQTEEQALRQFSRSAAGILCAILALTLLAGIVAIIWVTL